MKLKSLILAACASGDKDSSGAHHLLQSSHFFVRGLTRHPYSKEGTALPQKCFKTI